MLSCIYANANKQSFKNIEIPSKPLVNIFFFLEKEQKMLRILASANFCFRTVRILALVAKFTVTHNSHLQLTMYVISFAYELFT